MDILHDSNLAEMLSIRNVYELPSYVKEASLPDKEASAKNSESAYAWESKRLFPLTSKADTWLSTVYFEKHANEIPVFAREEIGNKLAQALAFWQIPESDFVRKPEIVKQASAHCELVYKLCGVEHAKVAVSSAEDIEKVANSLVDQREDMPWLMRANVALQALNAVDTLGLTINDNVRTSLQKSAGYCIATGSQLVKDLRYREALYANKGRPELSEKVASLRKSFEKNASVLPKDFQKVASVLDSLDRFVNLHGSYTSAFVAPEDVGHAVPLCTMRGCADDLVKLADGSKVSRKAIMDKSLSLRHALSKVAGKNMEEIDIVDTLQTLPAPVSKAALKSVDL